MAPRLAEVRELRPLVGSGLRVAVELRQRDDRDVELLGEQLERTADLGDLLLTVVRAARERAGHQLEVVDDDQLQALTAGPHPAGLRADVDDVHVAGVDDVQRHVVQDLGGLDDARPVVGTDALVADAIPRDACLRAQQAHADLVARHLEGEQRHGMTADRDVAGDVRGEGGLADARSGGDHDQVARLQPRREVVEVAEARDGSPV